MIIKIVIPVFVFLVVVLYLVDVYRWLRKTANATMETQRLLERLVKVTESVAKKEHPELYGKKHEEKAE